VRFAIAVNLLRRRPDQSMTDVAAPTLIVTGEHDTGSTPGMARRMHERITGSRAGPCSIEVSR